MNLVLTMAGKYRRFRLFGNKVPKYLMPLGKATVLWHVIYECLRSESDINVYLVANEADRDFQPIITAIMDDFSININNLTFIGDTHSQLETALTVADRFQNKFIASKQPVAFANIDTIVKSRRRFFDRLTSNKGDQGLVDTFIGSSHEYSYILAGDDGVVQKVSDGVRISENACSGLYGFGSGAFFCSEADQFLRANKEASFTQFYQALIDQGIVVYCDINSDARDTLVLGTPEEYITNVHRI